MDNEITSEFLTEEYPLVFTEILPLKKLALLQLANMVCHRGFVHVSAWNIRKTDQSVLTPPLLCSTYKPRLLFHSHTRRRNRCFSSSVDFYEDALSWWPSSIPRYSITDLGIDTTPEFFNFDFALPDDEKSFISYNECEEESLYIYVVKHIIPHLPIPPVLQMMLKQYVYYVITEVKKWANYFESHVFIERKNRTTHAYNYVNQIVWKSDGEIEYRETATKLLSCTSINKVEKFRIAAYYCLEGYIQKHSNPSQMKKKIDHDSELIAYWSNTKREHCKKFIEGYNDLILLSYEHYSNIHAILYFWKHMDAEKRVDVASKLIRYHNLKYQRALLLEMNESQRHKLFMLEGGIIIKNFSRVSRYLRYAVVVWLHIRESISEELYLDMMTFILHTEQVKDYRCVKTSQYSGLCARSDYINFVKFIWSTTPQHLRHICLNLETGEGLFVDFYEFDSEILLSLLTEILSVMEVDVRRHLFKNILVIIEQNSHHIFFELLCRIHDPWLWDRFLKLGFDNRAEEDKFRKIWIPPHIIEYHCLYLIRQGKINEFHEFFAIYAPVEGNVVDFQIHLLSEILSGKTYFYESFKYKPDPTNLKIFCSEMDSNKLIDLLTDCGRGLDLEIQFSLLCEILPDKDTDFRRNVLDRITTQQNVYNIFYKLIITFRRPLLLDKFIKLCLSDVEEAVAEYKSRWIGDDVIEEYCSNLMEKKEWRSVIRFLKLYLPRTTNVVEYETRLLRSRKVTFYGLVNEVDDLLLQGSSKFSDTRSSLKLRRKFSRIFSLFGKSKTRKTSSY